MVHVKVGSMRVFAFLTLLGLVLAGCQNERGFKAKAFPTTAAQAARQQRQNGGGNVDQPDNSGSKKDSSLDKSGSTPAPATPPATQQPSGPLIPQDPKDPKKDSSASPAAPAVQTVDTVLDTSAKLMFAAAPDVTADKAKAEQDDFKKNFSTEKSAAAQKVILGLTIQQDRLPINGAVQVMVSAVIDDKDGTGEKSVVATGDVQIGADTLVPLKSNLPNVDMRAYFCKTAECGNPRLLRVIVDVKLADGSDTEVFALFFQQISSNAKYTYVFSSIDPSKPFKPSYTIEIKTKAEAPKADVPKSDAPSNAEQKPDQILGKSSTAKPEIQGDSATTEEHGAVNAPEGASDKTPKGQDRVEQEPDGKAEKASSMFAKWKEKFGRFFGLKPQVETADANAKPDANAPVNTNSSGLEKPMSPDQAREAMDIDLAKGGTRTILPTNKTDGEMNSTQLDFKPISSDDAKKSMDQALAKPETPATTDTATAPDNKENVDPASTAPKQDNSKSQDPKPNKNGGFDI